MSGELTDFNKLKELTEATGAFLCEADIPDLRFILKPPEGDAHKKEIALDDIEVGPYGEVYFCFREYPRPYKIPSKPWFYWTFINGGWQLYNRIRQLLGLKNWYGRLPLDSWSRY